MVSSPDDLASSRFNGIARGDRAYWKASLALFLAGFSTFSLLYCVQPILPQLTREFGVSPAISSLALSFCTGGLAFAIFVSGALSQMLPRRGIMFASMSMAAICNLLVAFAPVWDLLLAGRLIEGLALGGVPAVAMAYLAEEISPGDLGKAMGLYVAGTALGGMAGRLLMGVMTDLSSWRTAIAIISLLDLLAAVGFVILLPASRNFVPQSEFSIRHHANIWAAQLGNRDLCRLFAVAFLGMGSFVTIFNYAGYRLSASPYDLSQTDIGLIFLAYLLGMFVSSFVGYLADRYGRRAPVIGAFLVMMLGVAVTLGQSLPLIVFGILMTTGGFFGVHAIASGWVGRISGSHKGHAAALYLLFYYLGSSILGTIGGQFWLHYLWPGVVIWTGCLLLIGLVLILGLKDDRVVGRSH